MPHYIALLIESHAATAPTAPNKPCRNGTESRETLPLWKRDEGARPHRRPVERIPHRKPCHNGTESRKTLPLWKRDEGARRLRRPVERIPHRKPCHNGTELRDLLPLWKRDGKETERKSNTENGKLLLFLRIKHKK